MKECPDCTKIKTLLEFSKNKSRNDGLQRICRDCVRIRSKKSYDKNPQPYKDRVKKFKFESEKFVDNFKTQNPCLKCGEKRIWVLDLHHKDKKTKLFTMSKLRGSGRLKKIKIELRKCMVLCSNCHRDFHYQERKNGIILNTYINQI